MLKHYYVITDLLMFGTIGVLLIKFVYTHFQATSNRLFYTILDCNFEENLEETKKSTINARRHAVEDDVTVTESQRAYTNCVRDYEKDIIGSGTLAYTKLAEEVANSVPLEIRGDIKVLDVGAGTGLVADSLKAEGFVHIDALDPNEAMLNEARKLGRYENYFVEYITKDPSTLKTGSYDVITACGVFCKSGHIEANVLPEMVRLVKPGGFIVIVNRFTNNQGTIDKVDTFMEKLAAENMWKRLKREICPNYNRLCGDYGILWNYQVL